MDQEEYRNATAVSVLKFVTNKFINDPDAALDVIVHVMSGIIVYGNLNVSEDDKILEQVCENLKKRIETMRFMMSPTKGSA